MDYRNYNSNFSSNNHLKSKPKFGHNLQNNSNNNNLYNNVNYKTDEIRYSNFRPTQQQNSIQNNSYNNKSNEQVYYPNNKVGNNIHNNNNNNKIKMDNNNDFQPNFGNSNKESSEIITDAVIQLSEKMGYPIEQKNGQRTFGPHPDDVSVSPPRGSGVGFFSNS